MALKRFEFADCIREGLLRNIPPSKEKAEGSMKAASKWLVEAEKNIKNEAFNSSVLSAYFLEEKYVKKKLLESKWIELLDHYREVRHNGQYDVSFFATKEEAENMLKTAQEFMGRISLLVKNNIKNMDV